MNWLPRLDSHQGPRGQSPACCCYTTRQRLVEPEVVATSPYRIKSPVPVCCGFDSLKLARQAEARRSEGWCSRQDSHLHWRRSRRRASSSWATRAEVGAPTRNCTELAPIPKECIAQNALEA